MTRHASGATPAATPATSSRRRLGNTAAWTLVDQALSSLTNVALSLVVARTVSATEFGGFSVALVVFSFAVGLLRAIVCEPYVISLSGSGGRKRRRAAEDAGGASLSLGAIASVGCLVAAFFLADEARQGLLALAIVFPGILLQDTWRFVFFSEGRPAEAALIDFIWAIAQFLGLGLLIWTGNDTVFLLVLAWGGAAVLGGVVGAVRAGATPRPFRLVSWWRSQHHLSTKFAIDYLVNMGAVNLAFIMIGSILGLAALGAVRGAQVLLGPLQLLISSIGAFALPLYARLVRSGRSIFVPALVASAVTGLVTVLWSAVLLLLPDPIGTQLLGQTWAGTRYTLVPMVVLYLAIALASGAVLGLKAMSRSGTLLAVTLVQAPLILGLGVAGAAAFGVIGAAAGMAAGQCAGCLLTWTQLGRRLGA